MLSPDHPRGGPVYSAGMDSGLIGPSHPLPSVLSPVVIPRDQFRQQPSTPPSLYRVAQVRNPA